MTNHTQEPQGDLKDTVLARIRAGEVHMRPRIYFILEAAGLLILAALVVAITAFLVNYLVFALDVEGHGSLLTFGPRGIGTFLVVFPWGWLILDLVLIVLTTLLVRRFRFGYRRSFLYIAGALCVIAIIAGVVVERGTSLNAFLLDDADHDRLPAPIGSLYEDVHGGAPHDRGVFRGIVDTVSTTTFSMHHDDFDHDGDDGSFTVIVPAGFDVSTLTPGERVYVAGTPTPEGIDAYGIQVIPAAPDSM